MAALTQAWSTNIWIYHCNEQSHFTEWDTIALPAGVLMVDRAFTCALNKDNQAVTFFISVSFFATEWTRVCRTDSILNPFVLLKLVLLPLCFGVPQTLLLFIHKYFFKPLHIFISSSAPCYLRKEIHTQRDDIYHINLVIMQTWHKVIWNVSITEKTSPPQRGIRSPELGRQHLEEPLRRVQQIQTIKQSKSMKWFCPLRTVCFLS